jgi:hypothetical protein
MEKLFLSEDLINILELPKKETNIKDIKKTLINRYGKNNKIYLDIPNNLKQILDISIEIKSVHIDIIMNIIKIKYLINNHNPNETYFQYNQNPISL